MNKEFGWIQDRIVSCEEGGERCRVRGKNEDHLRCLYNTWWDRMSRQLREQSSFKVIETSPNIWIWPSKWQEKDEPTGPRDAKHESVVVRTEPGYRADVTPWGITMKLWDENLQSSNSGLPLAPKSNTQIFNGQGKMALTWRMSTVAQLKGPRVQIENLPHRTWSWGTLVRLWKHQPTQPAHGWRRHETYSRIELPVIHDRK